MHHKLFVLYHGHLEENERPSIEEEKTMVHEDWEKDVAPMHNFNFKKNIVLDDDPNDTLKLNNFGVPIMTKNHFVKSWFHMADMWTDSISAELYTNFLKFTVSKIAAVDENGKLKWRSDDDIHEMMKEHHRTSNMTEEEKEEYLLQQLEEERRKKEAEQQQAANADLNGLTEQEMREEEIQQLTRRASMDGWREGGEGGGGGSGGGSGGVGSVGSGAGGGAKGNIVRGSQLKRVDSMFSQAQNGENGRQGNNGHCYDGENNEQEKRYWEEEEERRRVEQTLSTNQNELHSVDAGFEWLGKELQRKGPPGRVAHYAQKPMHALTRARASGPAVFGAGDMANGMKKSVGGREYDMRAEGVEEKYRLEEEKRVAAKERRKERMEFEKDAKRIRAKETLAHVHGGSTPFGRRPHRVLGTAPGLKSPTSCPSYNEIGPATLNSPERQKRVFESYEKSSSSGWKSSSFNGMVRAHSAGRRRTVHGGSGGGGAGGGGGGAAGGGGGAAAAAAAIVK